MRKVQKRQLEMNRAVKIIEEITPTLKDCRLIFVLGFVRAVSAGNGRFDLLLIGAGQLFLCLYRLHSFFLGFSEHPMQPLEQEPPKSQGRSRSYGHK